MAEGDRDRRLDLHHGSRGHGLPAFPLVGAENPSHPERIEAFGYEVTVTEQVA
jgi:hypothetical protein